MKQWEQIVWSPCPPLSPEGPADVELWGRVKGAVCPPRTGSNSDTRIDESRLKPETNANKEGRQRGASSNLSVWSVFMKIPSAAGWRFWSQTESRCDVRSSENDWALYVHYLQTCGGVVHTPARWSHSVLAHRSPGPSAVSSPVSWAGRPGREGKKEQTVVKRKENKRKNDIGVSPQGPSLNQSSCWICLPGCSVPDMPRVEKTIVSSVSEVRSHHNNPDSNGKTSRQPWLPVLMLMAAGIRQRLLASSTVL